ncbi:MAG: ribonuclease R [Bacteroidia bacterium]
MSKIKSTNNATSAELVKNILSVLRDHPKRNFNYKQLAKMLELRASEEKENILFAAYELIDRGDVLEVEAGKFKAKPQTAYIEGIIDITSTGAAFVMNDNFEDDIYINASNVKTALHGDKVKVSLYAQRRGKRMEGTVIEVLERKRKEFAGTVQIHDKFAFLIPDSNKIHVDIFIPLQYLNNAGEGDKAIASLIEWPDNAKNPIGKISHVLGRPGDNEAEINAIVIEYGFPLAFPEKVENDAERIPFEIPAEEIKKRRDFRKITTFTIDPVDAKDFDDALSVRSLKDEYPDKQVWEIGIHIADVSHYLAPGSDLDKEAYKRATSIYLVDRTIPMLPEKLSNGVCSLRPNEEKLCYSAVFHIDEEANVLDEWFGRTVILSDHRFAYEDAQQVIETGKGKLAHEILTLDRLAKIMRQERFIKGAIAFDKVEVKFKLDEKSHPIGVYIKESKDANKLIEEFMLLANKKVAEFCGKAKKDSHARPFVYRIHDSPQQEKIAAFTSFASSLGYEIKAQTDTQLAHSINNLMKQIKGSREENVLEQIAIRTMSKAIYSTDNIGHYGLAFDHYTHFTSPIRRYPDVMVHRLLTHYLKNPAPYRDPTLEDQCKHSTQMEIQASEAERASIKYKQVQFLMDKKGVVFEGIISGVTEWGIYIEIVENKCEGMIRLRDIDDDFYEFDEANFCIIGSRTGKRYQLGDTVYVEVKNADLIKKQIDFYLVEDGDEVSGRTRETKEQSHRRGKPRVDGSGKRVRNKNKGANSSKRSGGSSSGSKRAGDKQGSPGKKKARRR